MKKAKTNGKAKKAAALTKRKANGAHTVDPIRLSVIDNRLDAISKEIGLSMLRTSRSPIFSEARDFVTGIFDHELRLVAQTAYIPVLMGALPYAVRSIAQTFAGDVNEGDIFILNDPYRGNNHPPDITIAKPVFHKGKIEFWSVCKGHHADVGGSGVVGYNPGARSIWDECIRIPPAKLYDAGKINKALMDTILINVHLPHLVEGDLQCQVGAVTIGERNLKSLIEKYEPAVLHAAINQIFDASERQMRAVLRTVPNGEYTGERFIDHDGINKDDMIGVRVKLKVEEQDITFDFTASDQQAAGYINSTVPNTASSAFLALFMSVGSGVRFNEGALRALHVIAPAGTVVNANEPAPVTACTIAAAQAIIEAVWLALAKAVPDRVDACWSRWCAPASMGFNPRTGRPFGDIHFMAKGGGGASKGLDGWNHMGPVVCAGGVRAPDPELHELVNPYTVLQYEFWPDSAGAGEWRGGMGTIYRWRVETDNIAVANFGGGNRLATAPFGLQGGKAAPPHQLFLKQNGKTTTVDTESFYNYGTGDVFEIFQSGGGGFGDPRRRPSDKVQDDVLNGLVSVQKAKDDYGVVIDPANMEVDQPATRHLRAKPRGILMADPVRDTEQQVFETNSGIPIDELYDVDDLAGFDPARDLGSPGEFPFTRGPYEGMYRRRIWTRRFQVGFGSPKESNQRIRYLYENGANGFVITIDLPTSYGFDSDDEIAEGEVGVTGVAISTLEDMATLYDGFGPDKVSYALSIRPPVSTVTLAMLACVAEDKGVALKDVIGTQQNDPLYQMSGGPQQTVTQFFPLDGTLRLCIDNIEFISKNMPRLNWMVTNGYNLRETGVNAVEDGAFTLGHAFDIFRMARERGLDVNDFPKRASFFLSASIDFFEEIAKFRAMRRLYARTMKDKFGATDPACWRMRFSVQTAGNTLTTQQPEINIIRAGIEALAGVFGGAQSIHLCSYDEGHGLPTEESSRIALRTQQVLAYETGVTRTIDPLAGSYYVERLTNQLEQAIAEKIKEIDQLGGLAQAAREGWLEQQINLARYRNQQELDSGRRALVGVNRFTIPREEERPVHVHKIRADEWGARRAAYLKDYRARRDPGRWNAAIVRIEEGWKAGTNMVPLVMNALRNQATMGEIHTAMRRAQNWSLRK